MDFTETDMVAHHVRLNCRGGMGLKPSDYETIPLTAHQHWLLHQGVEREFYEIHGIDVEGVMKGLLERYLANKCLVPDSTFEELELLANVF